MKQAKRRAFKPLGPKRMTFAEALMRMPNVGTDADFERVDAVEALLEFMHEARPMTIPIDLKQLKDEGRA